MNVQSTVVLLLGVYRKVTLSRVATSSARQIVSDVSFENTTQNWLDKLMHMPT